MKMDHHCVFVQNCIGFRNQKAFYLYTLYMAAGLIQFWTATYFGFWQIKVDDGEIGFPPYSLKVCVLWLITSISAFFVGFMILALWFSHTMMVLTNHTTLMSVKSGSIFPIPFCQHRKNGPTFTESFLNSFDRGEIQNIKSLFGEKGIISGLLPL